MPMVRILTFFFFFLRNTHPMTNMFCGTQEVLQKPETERPRESGKLHPGPGGLDRPRVINDTQRAPVWHEVPAANGSGQSSVFYHGRRQLPRDEMHSGQPGRIALAKSSPPLCPCPRPTIGDPPDHSLEVTVVMLTPSPDVRVQGLREETEVFCFCFFSASFNSPILGFI